MIEPSKTPDPYAIDSPKDAPGDTPPAAEGGASARFSARVQDGVHVVTFEQSNVLDAYEIEQLGNDIYHYIKPVDAPKLVIDLGNVEHLSSAALGMLVALRKIVVQQKGGGLGIANVSKDLTSIFKMTNLDKLVGMYATTEKAIGSLR